MSKPVFYSGTKNASSWALRAWLALKAADYDFEEVVVDIRRPQRFVNLAKIGQFSPPACVPVLDTGTTVIFESLAIMEYANDVANGTLLPKSIEQRARARSLISWQLTGLSGICARISFESSFYPLKRPLTGSEQLELHQVLSVYETTIEASGGPYLFGQFSLADCMHAPTVIKFHRHNVELKAFPRTKEWFKTLVNHSLLIDWLTEADQLSPIWYDDYLLEDVSPVQQLQTFQPT